VDRIFVRKVWETPAAAHRAGVRTPWQVNLDWTGGASWRGGGGVGVGGAVRAALGGAHQGEWPELRLWGRAALLRAT